MSYPPNGPVPEDFTEVFQRPDKIPAIPVSIASPVPTWDLPAKRIEFESILFATGSGTTVSGAKLIIDGDPRLKRVGISCPQSGATAPFNLWIGREDQIKAPNGPYGFSIPVNGPVVFLEGFSYPVWAILTGPNSSAAFASMVREYWAD